MRVSPELFLWIEWERFLERSSLKILITHLGIFKPLKISLWSLQIGITNISSKTSWLCLLLYWLLTHLVMHLHLPTMVGPLTSFCKFSSYPPPPHLSLSIYLSISLFQANTYVLYLRFILVLIFRLKGRLFFFFFSYWLFTVPSWIIFRIWNLSCFLKLFFGDLMCINQKMPRTWNFLVWFLLNVWSVLINNKIPVILVPYSGGIQKQSYNHSSLGLSI